MLQVLAIAVVIAGSATIVRHRLHALQLSWAQEGGADDLNEKDFFNLSDPIEDLPARLKLAESLFRQNMPADIGDAAAFNASQIMAAHVGNESGGYLHWVHGTNNPANINAVGSQPRVKAKDSDKTYHPFRVFGSVGECLAEYIALIRRSYPEAWENAQAGAVEGYVHGLKYPSGHAPYFGEVPGESPAESEARVYKLTLHYYNLLTSEG